MRIEIDILKIRMGICKVHGKVLVDGMSNGIDSNRFNPAKTVKADLFSKQLILGGSIQPEKVCVVGFVGRLAVDKGVCELFQAWCKIREQFPDTVLLMLGAWDDDDRLNSALRAQMESSACRLSVKDQS